MYQELSQEDFEEGKAIIAQHLGDVEDSRSYFYLAHSVYDCWRSMCVTWNNDHLCVDGQPIEEWYAAIKRDPGADEFFHRGVRLRSLRFIPGCLILPDDRATLMQRAADGEDVTAATGEKNTARHIWIVEGERCEPLWRGSEQEWQSGVTTCTSEWPYCKNICKRRPRD
jgi:hypothetical protein